MLARPHLPEREPLLVRAPVRFSPEPSHVAFVDVSLRSAVYPSHGGFPVDKSVNRRTGNTINLFRRHLCSTPKIALPQPAANPIHALTHQRSAQAVLPSTRGSLSTKTPSITAMERAAVRMVHSRKPASRARSHPSTEAQIASARTASVRAILDHWHQPKQVCVLAAP